MFESTARGFNMFHDMYVTAKRAKTQRAIFCGWWRNEFYSADPESAVYKTYWDGRLTPEEREWTREIKKLYGFEINSRQMAWWRWKLAEGIRDDALMYQEFPPTEDYAFVTVLGLQLGSLLAGAVITETVFAWDGVGRLLVESIEKRDYPVTQACVLIVALTYVLVNFATDVLYTKIDPRVRFAQ